jgi:hypothetical protein
MAAQLVASRVVLSLALDHDLLSCNLQRPQEPHFSCLNAGFVFLIKNSLLQRRHVVSITCILGLFVYITYLWIFRSSYFFVQSPLIYFIVYMSCCLFAYLTVFLRVLRCPTSNNWLGHYKLSYTGREGSDCEQFRSNTLAFGIMR